jgi:hypothetical protein
MLPTAPALCLLALTALLQDPAPKDAPASKPSGDDRATRLLREAVHNMAQLPSVAVTCKQTTKAPFQGVGDQKDSVELLVDRAQGTLATVEDDELALVGGRMAIKLSDQEWALRRGVLSEGQILPFLPDLDAFWQLLDRAAAKATLGQPGAEAGTQTETILLTVTEDLAREFIWAGALPNAAAGAAGMVFVLNRAGGGGGRQPANKPDVTYELKVAINPAGRLIERVEVKGFAKGGARGGGAMVFRAGAGAVQIAGGEEEDESDEDAAKKKKDKSNLTYALTFKDHGKTKVEIPEAARKVLGR